MTTSLHPAYKRLKGVSQLKRYKIILLVIAVLLAAAWYAFRPERLFIKQRVHEELPTTQAVNSPAKPLASGKFHLGAHPTSGTAAVYQLAGAALVESAERNFGSLDKLDIGSRWPSFTTQGGGR
ncbi:hypothetical protein [Pedosphaera parvula]|uniref:Uncharacterized protein n=1 Tax=Pedosphaera parvula (strain Ellin514) TaxID=320771 RepID=B9XBY4_PEDPL|nr:hypothetical protein [Pedosphaera parvula]EEF62452.1 hypothetical protein Cflav_PD5087 [Pedosphaera parvula Ellin514]